MDLYLGLETKTADEIEKLKPGDLKEYQRHSIQKQVLGAGEPLIELITVKWLLPGRLEDMLHGKVKQIAHGLIRYRDVFSLPDHDPYESRFCWFYVPPEASSPNGWFYIGPRELNKTT